MGPPPISMQPYLAPIPTLIGKVFRVSPNELFFASVKLWRAVDSPWPGQSPFLNSDFYESWNEKALLAPTFSTKALTEQEDIVRGCVYGLGLRMWLHHEFENGFYFWKGWAEHDNLV